jgi:acyl carrier protein
MSAAPQNMILSEFIAKIAEEMYWDAASLSGGSTLIEDCSLDSMGMYELLLLLEDMGAIVEEEELFGWVTLDDVYRTFVRTDKITS